MDLLIGADFYWNIDDGLVKRGNGVASVALGLKLGIENNVLHIKTTNLEERKMTTFGN